MLLTCTDENDQSVNVCEQILEHREQGIPLRHQAVLFRTGHHSDLLELELTRRNIPFVKYGGLKFLESAHVKDLLCLLRVLENPHDEVSWFRALQLLDDAGAFVERFPRPGLQADGAPELGRGVRSAAELIPPA